MIQAKFFRCFSNGYPEYFADRPAKIADSAQPLRDLAAIIDTALRHFRIIHSDRRAQENAAVARGDRSNEHRARSTRMSMVSKCE